MDSIILLQGLVHPIQEYQQRKREKKYKKVQKQQEIPRSTTSKTNLVYKAARFIKSIFTKSTKDQQLILTPEIIDDLESRTDKKLDNIGV